MHDSVWKSGCRSSWIETTGTEAHTRQSALQRMPKYGDSPHSCCSPVGRARNILRRKPRIAAREAEEECWPVATELDAESAAGESTADGYLPRSEAAWSGLDIVQGLLILFERIVLLDGLPGELAYLRDRGKVDAVFLAALELGERMRLVAAGSPSAHSS